MAGVGGGMSTRDDLERTRAEYGRAETILGLRAQLEKERKAVDGLIEACKANPNREDWQGDISGAIEAVRKSREP